MRLQRLLLFSASLFAQIFIFAQYSQEDEYEHILKYHSDVTINNSTEVTIVESITVFANRNNINRGIYRDLPLSYNYRGGNVHVGFNLLSVKKDGKKEAYHTEWKSNGIRIYIGNKDVILNPGFYTYELTYQVDNVLGYFEDFDELYWNVNGVGWMFNIDTVSATVHLPKGATVHRYYGYTGEQGSQNQDYTAIESDNEVTFQTTKGLNPNENLTVAVAWDKNHLNYPTFWEKLWFIIRSYVLWFVGGVGIFIGLLYNFITWFRFGRDPKPGTIIPRYYAPHGFSPAECLYLKKGGKEDNQLFGSQLINLAVKGYINLKSEGEKGFFSSQQFTVSRTKDETKKEELNEVEQAFLNDLLASKDMIVISKKYNPKVAKANENLVSRIDTIQNGKYYVRNTHLKAKQFIWPVLFAGLGVMSYFLFGGGIWVIVLLGVLHIVMNVIFARLYEQPTSLGRRLMDEIAGFEMYMKYADKLRIKLINPPSMDFSYFEKNLAFAIALGVADEWKNQFDVKMIEENYNTHMPYMQGMAIAHLSSFSNNLSSTISSASVPPSSSGSGSGGGGFSGGGGGGGGGGGW